MEALTALLVAGLAATLVSEAVFRAFEARARLEVVTRRAERWDLASEWWRDTVSGVVRPRAGDDRHFRGDATALSGLTLGSLDGILGAAQPFAWRFEERGGETALVYVGADGSPVPVLSFQGTGGFRYWTAERGWLDAWPPEDLVIRGTDAEFYGPRAPQLIAAVVRGRDGTTPIVAARVLDGTPRQSREEWLRGLGSAL